MFTGLVEEIGVVAAVEYSSKAGSLTVASPRIAPQLSHGESVAVNGACVTVAATDGDTWTADVMQVTRQATTLGSLHVGQKVNLERAMELGGRLGGHLVQGHVDAQGEVVGIDAGEEWDDVSIAIPRDLLPYVVTKGSLTIDGVSLTVASLTDNHVRVSLIPTTRQDTTLGALAVGDAVNLEVDLIAKYVERWVGERD